MHPVLIKLGPVEIHSYGFMLAISFLVGIFWAASRGPKRGIDKNDIMDLSVIVVLCAILGSRFFYVITHTEEFQGRWLDTINPIQSTGEVGIAGLSMMGGVVMVLAALAVFCAVKKISIMALFDTMAPSFAFGIMLTRIGCFLNGCCFGKPGDQPWCMVFPMQSAAGSVMQNIAIHPTQLYASLYGLIILVVLVFLERKPRPNGVLSATFFMLYGLARFIIDFVRYYERSVQFRIFGQDFTFNQAISAGLFVLGLGLLIILTGRRSKTEQNS